MNLSQVQQSAAPRSSIAQLAAQRGMPLPAAADACPSHAPPRRPPTGFNLGASKAPGGARRSRRNTNCYWTINDLAILFLMSLSGLGDVGCSLAAAVHFWLRRSPRTPAFCPIATAVRLQIRRSRRAAKPKLSSLGPNFASTPQVRQAPGPDPKPDKLLGGGIDGQLRCVAAAASA